MRIALLHFSAPGEIGGIEGMIAAQCRALRALGHTVRLVVADGGAPPGVELVQIPAMRPVGVGPLPPPHAPSVKALASELEAALHGCEQCWIHNALTVYLQPALTVALAQLTYRSPSRWVAWCSDLTAASRFWNVSELPALSPGVRYVTISEARRADLSGLLQVPPDRIAVLPPPLDGLTWLGLGPEARDLVERLDLLSCDPIVLVPAKLLPHKNLTLAVRAAVHLPNCAMLITGSASDHDRETSARVRTEVFTCIREEHCTGRVHLLSDVLRRAPRHETVRDLMMLCDLVFLPSTEEGYGVPLCEAAALRCPVLCSDIPAFREAGAGCATYVPFDAAPGTVAAVMQRIAGSPQNRLRRDALRSGSEYPRQLQRLLASEVA